MTFKLRLWQTNFASYAKSTGSPVCGLQPGYDYLCLCTDLLRCRISLICFLAKWSKMPRTRLLTYLIFCSAFVTRVGQHEMRLAWRVQLVMSLVSVV